MRKNIVNPCFKCTERTQNCHGICEAYKKWVELNKEEVIRVNKEIRDIRNEDKWLKVRKDRMSNNNSSNIKRSF